MRTSAEDVVGWKIAEFGELKLKIVATALPCRSRDRPSDAVSASAITAHPRKALAILFQLNLQAFYLRSKQAVFVTRRLGSLFEVLYLCFKVFEMFLFPFSEGTLGCTVLCFAFLPVQSGQASYSQRVCSAYRRGL